MQILKGLVTVSGTVIALLIATIVTFFCSQVGRFSTGSPTGWDIKVLWVLTVYSPVYWLVVLMVVGLSVWVFKGWVLAHEEVQYSQTFSQMRSYRPNAKYLRWEEVPHVPSSNLDRTEKDGP